jgi:hypothetical protein
LSVLCPFVFSSIDKMDEAKTKRTSLPDAPTMLARLQALGEGSYVQEGLYPQFLKSAGSVTVGAGVALIIELAIYDFTKDGHPKMVGIVGKSREEYVDAICPDPQVAADAKRFIATARSAVQSQAELERGGEATSEHDQAAERYRRDRAFVLERSVKEPPIGGRGDIRSLEGMRRLVGQAVKYSKDQGHTWEYAVITGQPTEFQGGVFGYPAARELLPNAPVHVSLALNDMDFEQGMVVRIANEKEIEGMKFSGARAETLLRHKRLPSRHAVPRKIFAEWQAERDGTNLPTEVSEESKAAAKWWADQLRDGVQHIDAGTDPAVLTARVIAKAVSAAITDISIDTFEKNLARRIEAMEPGFVGKRLSVDYDPDRVLAAAARSAGLGPETPFPWKTSMTITPGKVEAGGPHTGSLLTVFPKAVDSPARVMEL